MTMAFEQSYLTVSQSLLMDASTLPPSNVVGTYSESSSVFRRGRETLGAGVLESGLSSRLNFLTSAIELITVGPLWDLAHEREEQLADEPRCSMHGGNRMYL